MNFAKKKIAVLGFGIEGQDICRFLLKKEAKITVFDQKSAGELGEQYKKFKSQGTEFKLGKDYLRGFSAKGRSTPGSGRAAFDWDFVFRSPAFKLSSPAIVTAKKRGAIITSATKLFFDLCPGKIIGVTGTKGKGTTATLIYEILKKAGKKTFLAGNIGKPMLSLLPKLDKSSWVVLELSSFQLQDLGKSPHIAVVLFITSEHLDYHRNIEEYIQAKTNVVRYQVADDFVVLNADNPTSVGFASLTSAQASCFSRQKKVNGAYISEGKIVLGQKAVGRVSSLQLRGAHNWDNVCAAITAASLAGADLVSIKKVVFSFAGLEHRLELIREVKEVEFYNDSFSTTPETAIAAIKAFKEPIILIAGGSEKGSDFTELGQGIAKSSARTLILIGQMAERIKQAVETAGYRGEIVFRPGKMREIVRIAFQKAKSGDVVLLSPACASFDMFANYKDRGNQFKKYVQAL